MTSGIPEIGRDKGLTAQEYAYARLRNAIITGAIAPGTALTVRGLAAELATSQTPIREAVRRLCSENAIEVLGNRRLRVPEMNPGRFEELVQLRIVLECHAARRALPHVSAVMVEELAAIDQRMDAAVAALDLDALTMLNHEFHRALYTLNPDQAVMPLIESIWLQLGPFQRQVIRNVETYYEIDHHKQMLAALHARDLAALIGAVESDIRDGILVSGRQLLADAGVAGGDAPPIIGAGMDQTAPSGASA